MTIRFKQATRRVQIRSSKSADYIYSKIKLHSWFRNENMALEIFKDHKSDFFQIIFVQEKEKKIVNGRE